VIFPCPYLDPCAFHRTSSPLSFWGGGVTEQFWWAPGIYPGQTKTIPKTNFAVTQGYLQTLKKKKKVPLIWLFHVPQKLNNIH